MSKTAAELFDEAPDAVAAFDAAQDAPSMPKMLEARQPEDPGALRSGVLGAAQGGTFGFADEIGGLLGKLFLSDPVKFGAAVQPSPDDTPEVRAMKEQLLASQSSQPTNYERVRNLVRQEAKDARATHPGAYLTGEIAGGLAAPIPGAGAIKGATVGARLLKAAGTGAALGGIGAIGASEGKTAGDVAKDAALGTAIGAPAGVLGYGVGQNIPRLLRALGDKARSSGIGIGRRVLGGGGDLASGSSKAISDEAVAQALDRGAILPGGTVGGAFKRLEQQSEDLGRVYGENVDELARLGVQGPHPRALADSLLAAGEAVAPNTMNAAVPRAYESAANQLLDKTEGSRLGLKQAEELKQSLQELAKRGYKSLDPGAIPETHMDIASRMRQAIEDEVARQAEGLPAGDPLREAADTFVPVKTSLGNAIAGRELARKGANKAAQNKAFGLLDMIAASGGMAHGGPEMGIAAGVASHLLRTRGGSTAASGAYWTGQGLRALAGSAAKNPRVVNAIGLKGLSAEERALVEALLQGQGETPEDPQAAGLAAALQSR